MPVNLVIAVMAICIVIAVDLVVSAAIILHQIVRAEERIGDMLSDVQADIRTNEDKIDRMIDVMLRITRKGGGGHE